MIRSRQTAVVALSALSLLTACQSKPTPEPVPTAAVLAAGQRYRDSVSSARAATDAANPANSASSASVRAAAPNAPAPPPPPAPSSGIGDGGSAVRTTMAAPTTISPAEARRLADAARATLTERVYFAYDQDDVSDDQKGVLEAKVPLLLANPLLRIRVGGHTDERGSDEYNMALGQRRAASVRRFLVSRGVEESRIDVVSFGRDRPLIAGVDEDTWARNRRAEFEIVAGGETLRAPR